MDESNVTQLKDALLAIESMILRTEKPLGKFAPGTAQHSLQKNRINALQIAHALVEKELTGQNALNPFTENNFEKAAAPIASLISKSEKAQQKLDKNTWQFSMLEKNLNALYIAQTLLEKHRQA